MEEGRVTAGEFEPVSSNATLSPVLKSTRSGPLNQFEAAVDHMFATPSPRQIRFEGGCSAEIAMLTAFVRALPSDAEMENWNPPMPMKPAFGANTAKWPFE